METEVDRFEEMAPFHVSIVSIERFKDLSIMLIVKWLANC